MRWIKYALLTLLIITAVVSVYFWNYARTRVPLYEGQVNLAILDDSVRVQFDAHGIPHITAQSAADAYRALGYIQASERLFQMELVRRVGKGELAEVIGRDALESDVFFRTAGVVRHARQSASDLIEGGDPEALAECRAFLEGVNAFIDEGKMPLEFKLADIPMTEFALEDIYAIAGYMAWSFALAAQTDFLATELSRQHPEGWLNDMGLDGADLGPYHPVCNEYLYETDFDFPDFLGKSGVPTFSGSNAWAVCSRMSTSGKPILCNDTHIGYGVPQVWYEAALTYPGFALYGNFLPGIPYALVGHTPHHAWGLTMFENDDIDFYREQVNPDGSFVIDQETYQPESFEERISVKGEADTSLVVLVGRHGPIMNGALNTPDDISNIAMRWEYTRGRNHLLEAFRGLNRAPSIDRFMKSAERIHAPGLNIVYADTAENIAWWACARLPIRPKGVNSKMLIDGSTTATEYLGYYPFSGNPQCINPAEGYVYSANEQPDAIDSVFTPGYYVPPSRSKRIANALGERVDWDREKMQALLLDVINEDEGEIARSLFVLLKGNDALNALEQEAAALLDWDGSYDLQAAAPVLYQPLQVALLRSAMQDKMSPNQFDRFRTTHWMRRLMLIALRDAQHPVWDVSTTDGREYLDYHLNLVFPSVVERVADAHGKHPSKWTWGEAHTWQPKHPFHQIPLVGAWLNSDSYAMAGSNETISQSGFTPSDDPTYIGRYGAQMRIVIDLAAPEHAVSVSPVGQSGHKLSKFYNDQAALYASGQFRPQSIQSTADTPSLYLVPAVVTENQ